jgi:ABC-type polysaccharide/polyol phosphate transport system ATPase subunit
LQKNIIAYINDIVVMSKKEIDHIEDLKETFANLKKAGLKLNLKNVSSGLAKGRCSDTSSVPKV